MQNNLSRTFSETEKKSTVTNKSFINEKKNVAIFFNKQFYKLNLINYLERHERDHKGKTVLKKSAQFRVHMKQSHIIQ